MKVSVCRERVQGFHPYKVTATRSASNETSFRKGRSLKPSFFGLVLGAVSLSVGLFSCEGTRTVAPVVAATNPCSGGDGRAAVAVAVPARPGPVKGTAENSDVFIWRLLTSFVAPTKSGRALFETWASDKDTFSTSPHWPDEDRPVQLRASTLALEKLNPSRLPLERLQITNAVDEPCKPPRGAAVGGFPTDGHPAPCIAEQVARNRAQFDYIVKNSLNTRSGLAAAYKAKVDVDMPTESIALKADWVPLPSLLAWVPELKGVADARSLYHTTLVNSVEYALVALHVSSRQNPNWVWATFEHEMNPGRCDDIGCWDTFGAVTAAVPPNHKVVNGQYGPCAKTAQLAALMKNANLSPQWKHYCLKSSQVDYSDADGTPYVLGNSVIEGIVGNGTVAASSCISCHRYASFGPDGQPTAAAEAILPFNPTGEPIKTVLAGSSTFAFMWGVLQAP